jgi:hypothetical protein
MPKSTTTWVPTMIGNCVHKSQRQAAKWYLMHSKLSQSAIARKVMCSAPCVCQVAAELKKAGVKRPSEK